MQCAHCGFAQPGEASACPGCGRAFAKGPAAPLPPPVGSGSLHLLAYALLLFSIARVYASLWARYVAAEEDRVESVLVSQALEHKRQVLAAERAADGEGGS